MRMRIGLAVLAILLLIGLSARADDSLSFNQVSIHNLGSHPDSVFFFGARYVFKSEFYYPQPLPQDSSSIIWQETKQAIQANPKQNDALVFAAIKRFLSSAPDSYSHFYDPKETIKEKQEMFGKIEVGGIGATLCYWGGKVTIFTLVRNAPAQRAGLRPGDQILKVDKHSFEDAGPEDGPEKVANCMRGPIGTEETVIIQRLNEPKPLKFKMVREKRALARVNCKKLDENIYYLSLADFDGGAFQDFCQGLNEMGIPTDSSKVSALDSGQNKKKVLIVDLRNNPGGLGQNVVSILGLWTSSPVMTLRCQKEEEHLSSPHFYHPLKDFKTIILTGRPTSSSAEVMTGALRDYGLATIVGDTTYGKGSFQVYYEFPFKTLMKITNGLWLTPKGYCVEGVGLGPDFFVKFDKKIWFEKGIDNQLEKALEIARQQQ